MARGWWRTAPWPLICCGLLMEVGWVIVGAAGPRLTESDGFSQTMLQQLPPVWEWAAALRRTQTPEALSKVLFVGGLGLACVGFVGATWWLAHTHWERASVWIGVGVAVFCITLLVTPGLLSTDVVMYAVYGRMAGVYGLNPYVAAPSSIGGDQLLGWANRTPQYATYATAYGPLWTAFSAALGGVTGGQPPLVQTFPYRLVGLLSHIAIAWLVWCLVPRVTVGAKRALALLVYAWNPLALFELVASGHNDGVMVSLVLAGLLLASRGQTLRGVTLVWAGALVKWVPGIVALYMTCVELKSIQGWSARVQRLATVGALCVGVTLVLFGPWLDARASAALQSSVTAGGQRYVNAIVDLPTSWLVAHVVDRGGSDLAGSEAMVRAWSFGLARLALAGWVLLELWRLWRGESGTRCVLEASVRTLLVALLLAVSQVLAWYFVWPLALAAPLGARSMLAQLAAAYSVLYLPLFYAIHEDMLSTLIVPPLLAVFVLGPPLAIAVVRRAGAIRPLVSASRRAAA